MIAKLTLKNLREGLSEVGPILRRFVINTLFDSTFTQLGILIGSAFAQNSDTRLVIATLVSSSVALGISTGVSVYESEMMERERKTIELEKALFRKLDRTTLTERYRNYARILSIVNFITPLACCGLITIPLIIATLQILNTSTAAWVSITISLAILFAAGIYFGRQGKKNPLIKGLRMLGFGAVAFIIGYLIQTLI